jgi:CubicO group peptidase (beta-lactamase class C family)
MQKKFILITIVLGLSVVLALSSPDAHQARSPDVRDFPNLDSIIEANMVYGHLPGVQACAIKDGEIIWQGAYGYARLSDSMEVTDSTIFNIASISKTVTSVALMQSWEMGCFNLDDDINEHLSFDVHNPWYPTDSITPRTLLTHTSSIWDRWTILDTLILLGDSTLAIREFCEQYLCPGGTWYSMMNFGNYLPGTHFDYCNVGITLVGHLLEAVTNSPDGYFIQHCEDSIFAPLNMNRTCWLMCDVDTNHMAMPYYTSGSPSPVGYISTPIYPAASLKTTAIELSKFLRAFQNYGQSGTVAILDSATVEEMTTIQYPSVTTEWGLGWWCITFEGRELWGHHGGPLMGHTCEMWFCKDEKSGAIVLSNGDHGDYSRNATMAITDALLDYALEYGINELQIHPPSNHLITCQPNPFTTTTEIRYHTPKETHVRITVYNAAGQRMATLVDASQEAGPYSVLWDATDLPNGVYLCRMETNDYTKTQKVLLMR